ncbi:MULTISPECIES: hypothetical protein [unclassified Mycobacterium]|jgi:hypothetical protein|uniref:hypothetical protein n=1 Tax=unclassified Mycobacterium TaxID=2642494 RepID=UPI000AE0C011|nr:MULTISPECIES: hypothetical protein [unclassified Mycobacterium]
MARNRLDFVRPGTVSGQIAEVSALIGNEHVHYRDGPDGKPIAYSAPGIDTKITLSGHPFVYGVRAREASEGPEVMELHIDSPEHDVPITPADLRKLARYLDRLAHAATVGLDPTTQAFLNPEKPPPKRPGPHGHSDTHYASIAEFAKQAHRDRQKNGLSVRRAIAEHYQVSVDTANKWLARARKAGHLQAGDLGGKPKPRKGSSK